MLATRVYKLHQELLFQTTLLSHSTTLKWYHQSTATHHVRLLIRSWHALHLFTQCSPVVCLQLSVLDALLTPFLV